MKPYEDELFDYAPILLRVDQLARELHDACLHKQFDKVPAMANELIDQSVLLKLWARKQ